MSRIYEARTLLRFLVEEGMEEQTDYHTRLWVGFCGLVFRFFAQSFGVGAALSQRPSHGNATRTQFPLGLV